MRVLLLLLCPSMLWPEELAAPGRKIAAFLRKLSGTLQDEP
jgi:hypothetical protein